MEKVLVISAIWAMCALCGVLFIRGATYPGATRTLDASPSRGDDADTVEG